MDNEELLKMFYKENDEKMRFRYLDLMLLDCEEILEMILKNIKNNKELKNNAYALNILSKKKKVSDYLNDKLSLTTLLILLNSDDSKVRKNTYIMLGNLKNENYSKFLLDALEKENVNYCIPSIILSLGNYNVKNIKEILDNKLKESKEKYASNKMEKAQYEMIEKSIEKVLLKNISFKKHTFTDFKEKRNILLTIMPALRNASMNEIKSKFNDARFMDRGIVVSTSDYRDVFSLRTFYEALLFEKQGLELSKEKINDYIVNSLKNGFISSCHDEEEKFYYRIEIKSTINKKSKLEIIEGVKESIDKNLNDKYINNPSLYEFEIRIVEKDDNKFDVYYKLFTLEDKRYSYRVTDLPASINPTTAAILMQEIKGYFRETSEVLDAFCGTSTMLIERSFIKNYKSLTGIDISEEAINDSKINANNVPVNISLVCDDIIKYNGPEFDEIISNMPFGNRVSNHELNITLYKRFIAKLDTMLKDNGYAFLLTSELSLMKSLVNQNKKLKLVKNIYVESGGLKPHLFVVKKVS